MRRRRKRSVQPQSLEIARSGGSAGQAGAEVNPWLVTFNVAGARTDITASSGEQQGVSRNPWFIRFNETGDQDIVTFCHHRT